MSQDIRRELISRNLGIIPINHGQIYTFQVALPETERQEVSLDRYQAIERSLLQHQSNLVSLIVRRTTAYDDEDIEYELVYGAEWLQAAQSLNIETLWAWVFDMTDEQAQAAKTEMKQLFDGSNTSPVADSPQSLAHTDLERLIDRKLVAVTDSMKQTLITSLDQMRADVDEKLKRLHHRLGQFDAIAELSSLPAQLHHLTEQLTQINPRSRQRSPFEGPRLKLQTASPHDIETALMQIGTQPNQIKAALNAIEYWQTADRTLTWENLARSARADKKSADKITGFAKGAYERLRLIGEIDESIGS